MTRIVESYTFDTAADLRDWLNQFKTTDLDTVFFDAPRDFIILNWLEETLSDGSKVYSIRIQ